MVYLKSLTLLEPVGKRDPGSGGLLRVSPVGGHPEDHPAAMRLLQVLGRIHFL